MKSLVELKEVVNKRMSELGASLDSFKEATSLKFEKAAKVCKDLSQEERKQEPSA